MLTAMTQPIILKRQAPLVTLCDVQESTANASVYTFTSVSVSPWSGCPSVAGETYAASPHLRSATRGIIACIVHAEDAAVTFGVSSVTLGGVGGTERVDRGGGTNAINTAIYTWTGDILGGITTTDIVVTFSEAVTGCAIGIVQVSNVGVAEIGAPQSNSGTGDILIAPTGDILRYDANSAFILGSTMITGATSETFSTGNMVTGIDMLGGYPVLLYEGQNAEFAYAGAYAISNQYTVGNGIFSVMSAWSGATAGDVAGLVIV